MAAVESKISGVKVKPTNQGGPSRANLVVKKKPESSARQTVSTTVAKSEVKSKAAASSSKSTTKTVTTRVKKVFNMAGQKFDPPEEREPLRIFYESLSKQIPSSEMAEFWMMEHGLLSPERAKRAHDKKQRKQKQIRMGTPIKSSTSYSRPESSSQRLQQQPPKNGDIKAKKRMVKDSDDDDDDDFLLSSKKRRV